MMHGEQCCKGSEPTWSVSNSGGSAWKQVTLSVSGMCVSRYLRASSVASHQQARARRLLCTRTCLVHL